eukprot:1549134-Amphidinium_carterae.3
MSKASRRAADRLRVSWSDSDNDSDLEHGFESDGERGGEHHPGIARGTAFHAAGAATVSPLGETEHEVPVAGDDLSEGDDGEPTAPVRPRRGSLDPTPHERDAHECAGHFPFRSWCRSCIAGKARHDPHARAHGEHQALAPILVGRDNVTKVTYAEVLLATGTGHRYCVTALVNFILRLGHHRVILRSDTEHSITDLRAQAASALKVLRVDVQVEDAADSQENGLAEGAVRDVKAQARTLAYSVQEHHRVELQLLHPRHPILAWLVMHAAGSISRGQIGRDGRIAHERLRGMPYRRFLPPFAEIVMARDDSKESRVQQRWHRCIFLGVVPKSNSLYVGDHDGVQIMRTVRRLPPSESRDAAMLDALRGAP